jgi:Carboxypeptidase regulatory-like domain
MSKSSSPANRKKKTSARVLTFGCCLAALILLGAGASYVWLYFHPPATARSMVVIHTVTFKPVVGDVNDPENDDPDITVEQGLVPGFQFQHGGYTLSGEVTDARSGQPVTSAVVWIDLPVQEGRPTSIALHTLTDANGAYQFRHLAAGSYTVVASRYYTEGDGRYYGERVFLSVSLKNNRSDVVLPLTALAAPGKRSIANGQAKNVILLDLRGFYAASLLDDALLVNQAQNVRAFLQHAYVLRSLWDPYGWRPLDQYALLTGTYPQWATYDPWPHLVPWGVPDAIDTTYWYTGGRSAHLFGQESLFDVAKGYGMQTGVVAGSDYILSDATTRNVDLLQRYSTFSAEHWLEQMEDAVLNGTQASDGFLLYGELAPLSADDGTSSPDAQGDGYQQALLLADQTFGQFVTWLGQQGLLQNTLIALTTSQAQANHTDADNFYGMGTTGQGTSKQTVLALSGPGICASSVDSTNYSSFIIAPVLMQALGLPAPAEVRMPSPFWGRRCI